MRPLQSQVWLVVHLDGVYAQRGQFRRALTHTDAERFPVGRPGQIHAVEHPLVTERGDLPDFVDLHPVHAQLIYQGRADAGMRADVNSIAQVRRGEGIGALGGGVGDGACRSQE
ncbi:MAG: hypothetical protein KatS3mg051_1360 [Anaerolineae bacterium]|nr:MAG: hypothetical protein KatS3mg051_1360 [Anaerolineae bacterium]